MESQRLHLSQRSMVVAIDHVNGLLVLMDTHSVCHVMRLKTQTVGDVVYGNILKFYVRFLLLVCFIWTVFALSQAYCKELSLIVPVKDLSSHDDEMVSIFAYIQLCEPLKGRMGSNYLKCTASQDGARVTVYSDFPLYNALNRKMIIQGKYHAEGRFAGMLADHFISATLVERDWE